MNSEIIFLVEEDSVSGFIARALGQSIVTEAETLEELREKIRDAIRCHFDENDLPRIIRLHFVKEEVIAL
ncbi:2-oxoisovalerate dehydrogenase [Mesotoga sp. Brook.08.YT.4.2.5.1]|uniref:2-oxoisovalerate dehydrogenase n=1 Tax=unclassified Mesotoga TaxID=1184398 RepID=UPI000C9B5709|nr:MULTISPECIES: 2-oxoisovalerate dehydrogenase [unclassified Mesotoga]RAM60338.1 2-oxoisovalerate dehydrogenase [Mesotoga sp. SC_4PWA21]PNE20122.1 2-oxoisovalerate dehydrogenase [Mesotoga sp. Brook.08.YT.4.2.5.1]PNS40750.1 2-oxoisovalerate dehydrogenase [Mesotoga sp. B105.6.4]RAO96697.1 2-oxoisovalerate dehydrogenase E1 subunit beta [Mesotoga sp. Brook.08.YT.4.2.5.4.]RDI93374.1 2-oxoisovalerate dehydrogenase [Mesotoga sp. Brook.08.YT.4.2.5.2.]